MAISPITFSSKVAASDNVDRSSYTTASWTPTANRLLLLFVGSNTTPSSVSGNGVTWTLVRTQVNGAFRMCLYAGIATSPTTGATTISHSGTDSQQSWAIIEANESVDISGGAAAAIVQSAGNNASPVTLSAFSNINNATVGGIRSIASTSFTPGSGFSELNDTASSETSMQTQYKSTNDTGVDWSGFTASGITAIAAEIKSILPIAGSSPMFFSGGVTIG